MDPHVVAQVQTAMQAEFNNMKALQQKHAELVAQQTQYSSQLTENQAVLAELQAVSQDDDGAIFKLMGPVLAKQDTDDAIGNVEKRISFMQNKVKDLDNEVAKQVADLGKSRDKIGHMQELFKNAQQEAAAKAQQEQDIAEVHG